MNDDFFDDEEMWKEDFFLEETSYSTRDQNGVITYYKTIEEAVEAFAGYDGYRLSIDVGTFTILIHRDELPEIPNALPGSISFDDPSALKKYQATVHIYRDKDR